MASKSINLEKKTSLSSKFNRSLLILLTLLALVLIPAVYLITKSQVMEQANKELTLLVDMIESVQDVVREETRPHFTPKGEFYPITISSTVMAKTVAEKFARIRPEYYIKIFSDKPLNVDNSADQLETKLLQRFRENKQLKSIVESGIIQGESYLLSATPTVVKKECLLCHGDPEYAPASITRKYGTNSGFGWKTDEVVGGSAVGVPLADVDSIAVKRTIYALLILATIFAMIYLYINTFVRRSIISPLLDMSKSAKSIAKGNLEQSLDTKRNDEIGQLANAFEMMRRSYITLVKRINPNDDK